ncbi:NAD-dependent succinate-semialdehyde dehydrogenase [Mesorhizobium sp. 8]|uniref:NAD-dependent succinate-semialdehyde dehydrogenase n=1 Tax=Mesorhizobium sp. 8 TaxID=2584466 RepID=UPI0011231170|nr:NAD-dependent succinate-semialdehyde dehydrogenase [Mesorhizobium sp. 8]QDC00716.1 NAD-dependent succinate-semialdehyde dehydrogenase [Mesorhizobium sp. 8]
MEMAKLFIDGEWREGSAGRSGAVVDPATGEVFALVTHAGPADLDCALAAAQRAFLEWRLVSPYERSKLLRKAADLLRQRAETIAALMTREQGKPLAESLGETVGSADHIDWYAEEGRRAYGRLIPARAPGVRQIVIREPVGPVAGFSPWNFPVSQAVRKIAGALAAGCTIIIKCPEETPFSAIELVRCFADAGIPAGAVNLVFGVPAEISEYLIPAQQIRKISFTGSIPVGKLLGQLAAAHVKRATLELGGHSPFIVCEDADPEAAVKLGLLLKYRNAGQVCAAPSRYFVHERHYKRFVDAFVAGSEALKVGPGTEPGVQMGPLANSRRLDAMQAFVADAESRGAKVLTGGKRIGNQGNFFAPTVLVDTPEDARLMVDEPFGPLAPIASFASLDDAIARSNSLPYGLAAFAFTNSERTSTLLGDRLESGMISINHFGIAAPETPFGGIKESGFGSEGGVEGLDAFLQTKFISELGLKDAAA